MQTCWLMCNLAELTSFCVHAYVCWWHGRMALATSLLSSDARGMRICKGHATHRLPDFAAMQDAAGQLTRSPFRFNSIGTQSPLLWLARRYAVLDGPTMPIVAEGEEEPNDTYVQQLTDSARAAIQAGQLACV